VSLSAGVGEEVRANGLDGAVLGGGDARDGLEVLLGSPAAGERRKGRGDLNGSHCDGYGCREGEQKVFRLRWLFFRALAIS
jgi:hypothetical protein